MERRGAVWSVAPRREYLMGHQRLGTLPRSKLWRDVVELIEHRVDVEEVAAATSLAAEQSMIDASQDAAVQHAFYLWLKFLSLRGSKTSRMH